MPGTDEYELEEIKREIVESRSLTIKTNNLVNALSADLKSIAKRQQSYERRIFFNSATAYVVTVAVMFFALKLAWDARVDAVRAETRDQRQKLQQLQDELKDVQGREEARARTANRAGAFYALVTQNKRKEIVEQFDGGRQAGSDPDRTRGVRASGGTGTQRAIHHRLSERARVHPDRPLARSRDPVPASLFATRRTPSHSSQATYELAGPCASSGSSARRSGCSARSPRHPPTRR